MSRLASLYREQVIPRLQEDLQCPNPMAVPRLVKIILNMGVGAGASDKDALERAAKDLTLISGQKPVITRARRSIAGFKIRAGWNIGCKVTLRQMRMYEFLDRLINVAIPRIRDFRGLNPQSFDGRGNFSMGIAEQIIFPEINYDSIDVLRGMDVTIVTSTTSDERARALLSAFNFPFRRTQ